MTPEEALGIKKTATEETLQSIDGTLKRIETILRQGQKQSLSFALDGQVLFSRKLSENLIDSHVEPE